MESAENEVLKQLFRENNELRTKYHTQSRELFNKTFLLENAEEEIQALKTKLIETEHSRPAAEIGAQLVGRPGDSGVKKNMLPGKVGGLAGAAAGGSTSANAAAVASITRELEEAQTKLEQQSALVKQLKEQLQKSETHYTEQQSIVQNLQAELEGSREQVAKLNQGKADLAKQLEAAVRAEKLANQMAAAAAGVPVDANVAALQNQLANAEGEIALLEQQLMDAANESNSQFNEQQLQIQGMEALIDQIRRSYEDFVQLTKFEAEAYKASQQHEYDVLKKTFEQYKRDVFEEKRTLLLEYQTLLQAMQTQFDEFRVTSEYLFSSELVRVEDEMSVLTARYEQEIAFITQSKDRFYADLMVAKDAKLMNLLAGADMLLLMQQHEAEIDLLRREQAKEIERVKANQESEHKNIISLIQRQNLSLEAKSERFQQHIRSLENKIRDLTGTIESKNKQIEERDEGQVRLEEEFHAKTDDLYHKINTLTQEKEQLRHRIIRFKMDAKGDGENSVDILLGRLSHDASQMQGDFAALSARFQDAVSENEKLEKQSKETKRTVDFLESELLKRNKEYNAMTSIFEQFLRIKTRYATSTSQGLPSSAGSANVAVDVKALSKSSPTISGASAVRGVNSTGDNSGGTTNSSILDRQSRVAIERGHMYLRKFKALSRAYASGDFRVRAVSGALPSKTSAESDDVLGSDDKLDENMAASKTPWKHLPIYKRMDEASKMMAKIYQAPSSLVPGDSVVALEDAVNINRTSKFLKPATPANPAKLYHNPDETLSLEEAYLMVESNPAPVSSNNIKRGAERRRRIDNTTPIKNK